jgi:hypothetical protein
MSSALGYRLSVLHINFREQWTSALAGSVATVRPWSVAGYLVAAAAAVAVALIAAGRRYAITREESIDLGVLGSRHVAILGGLAGFAVTGLALLVTLGRNLPTPRVPVHDSSHDVPRRVHGLLRDEPHDRQRLRPRPEARVRRGCCRLRWRRRHPLLHGARRVACSPSPTEVEHELHRLAIVLAERRFDVSFVQNGIVRSGSGHKTIPPSSTLWLPSSSPPSTPSRPDLPQSADGDLLAHGLPCFARVLH